MAKKNKENILKHFKLSDTLKNKLLNSRWKYVDELNYNCEKRQQIYKEFKMIDSAYRMSYAEDIDPDIFWSEDKYRLMESEDKYYIEHENYIPGGGTDYWCYFVNK